MIQIALILKTSGLPLSMTENLSQSKIAFETLEPQEGISEIARELGLERESNPSPQAICLVNLSLTNLQEELNSLIAIMEQSSSGLDFLLLPQSAQAYEPAQFLEYYQGTQEEPESLFINLISIDERTVSLGLNSWGLEDIMVSGTDDSALNRAMELSLFHINQQIKIGEKFDFDGKVFKATIETSIKQPEGLENPAGVIRLIQQVS